MKLQYLRLATSFAALALVAGVAHAQSSVTLYGIVDTGVEFVSHANAQGKSLVRMPLNTGSLPSRWGLRGSEDLGGGLSAQFDLENGFTVAQGTLGQGGRLFGRQAWVGLANQWGLLSFGRQYSMTFWGYQDDDLFGPDLYGTASLDPWIANARSDNTIAYKGTFSGLTLGATYSFGRDSTGTGNSPGQGTCAGGVPGQFSQCAEWSAMIKYDAPMFGLAATYDQQRGGTGAAANLFNGVATIPLTASSDSDSRAQFGGYYKWGKLKLGADFIGRTVETPSLIIHSNIFLVAASYLFTPQIQGDLQAWRVVNAAQDTRASMIAARGTYFLSKASAVYIQTGYIANSRHAAYGLSAGGAGATPGAGMGQLGVDIGVRHTF